MQDQLYVIGFIPASATRNEKLRQIKRLNRANILRMIYHEKSFPACLDQLNCGETLIGCALSDMKGTSLPEFSEFMKACTNKGVGFGTLKEGDFVDADLSNPDVTPQLRLFK